MVTDPIADMLTIIRNAYRARLKRADITNSLFKVSLAEILKVQGYISDYKLSEDNRTLTVTLRYVSVPNSLVKQPVLSGISRLSKPGLRVYRDSTHMPRVLGGLGTVVVSTSKGLMSAKDARKQGIGGELVCKVW